MLSDMVPGSRRSVEPSGGRAPGETRLSAAALDTLLELLPVGVLLTDRRGRLRYANGAACRILGISASRDGALGARGPDDVSTGVGGPLHEAVRWAVTRALLLDEQVRDEEIEYRRGDGLTGWIAVSAIATRSAAGAVEAGIVTVADVTARKRAAAYEPLIESLSRL